MGQARIRKLAGDYPQVTDASKFTSLPRADASFIEQRKGRTLQQWLGSMFAYDEDCEIVRMLRTQPMPHTELLFKTIGGFQFGRCYDIAESLAADFGFGIVQCEHPLYKTHQFNYCNRFGHTVIIDGSGIINGELCVADAEDYVEQNSVRNSRVIKPEREQ
jgi:hypothetical protein